MQRISKFLIFSDSLSKVINLNYKDIKILNAFFPQKTGVTILIQQKGKSKAISMRKV